MVIRPKLKQQKTRIISSVNQKDTKASSKQMEVYKDEKFDYKIEKSYMCVLEKEYCKSCEHCFSFYRCSSKDLIDILDTLNQYKSWSWREIEKGQPSSSNKSKNYTGYIGINKLEPDVQKMILVYLKDMRLDEEFLYKIRIKNHHRVWGIRKDTVFYPIWNDTEHRFYKHDNKSYTPPKQQ